MFRRALSTTTSCLQQPAATTAVAAAAAAGVPALPHWAKVPSAQEAVSRGLTVSPSWARYNLESSASMDLAEARKLPVMSGIDSDFKGRRFIIYRGTQNAMTSGKRASSGWRIRVNHTDKWSNPLMGWVSSMETVNPMQRDVKFESAEQAILFCERNGFSWEINQGAISPDKAGQVDNQIFYVILPKDVQARMKSLGVRRSRSIWARDEGAAGKSHFINLRRTQYGSEPWRPADNQTDAAWTGPAWPEKPAEEHHH